MTSNSRRGKATRHTEVGDKSRKRDRNRARARHGDYHGRSPLAGRTGLTVIDRQNSTHTHDHTHDPQTYNGSPKRSRGPSRIRGYDRGAARQGGTNDHSGGGVDRGGDVLLLWVSGVCAKYSVNVVNFHRRSWQGRSLRRSSLQRIVHSSACSVFVELQRASAWTHSVSSKSASCWSNV